MAEKMLIAFAVIMFATTCPAEQAVVKEVIDGDTFLLSNGRKVRLIGVDCPEMHYPSGEGMLGVLRLRDFMSPEELAAMGPALQKIADRLNGVAKLITELVKVPIEGKTVELEFDEQAGREDRYERVLAYVWVTNRGQRQMVNALLLKHGMARVYDAFPFSKLDEFKKLEKEARDKRLGIWRFPVIKKDATGE